MHAPVGTLGPIRVSKVPGPTPKLSVVSGESYFVIKVAAAQVAFRGDVFMNAKQVLVKTVAQLTTRPPSPEAHSLQKTLPFVSGQANSFAITDNLIDLTPAQIDAVTLSLDFFIDRENKLNPILQLINDKTLVAALSLAAGPLGIVTALGAVANGILRDVLAPNDRVPFNVFSHTFNIGTDPMSNSEYYIWLATKDPAHPLPVGLDPERMAVLPDGELLINDLRVLDLSYVVLDIQVSTARDKERSRGEKWYGYLSQVQTATNTFLRIRHPTDADRDRAWKEIGDLLNKANVLISEDPLYLQREAEQIIYTATESASEKIYPSATKRGEALAVLAKQYPSFLGKIDDPTALSLKVRVYEAALETSRNLLGAVP